MARFTNKVGIITGGASGIGKKTAEMFVEQGGKILIGDVDDVEGQKVSDEITAKFGRGNISYIHLDVSDPDQCQAAVNKAVSEFGGVHCLLNSAIKMAPGLLKDLSLSDWNTMVDIGLTGTFLMTQAAGRWMIENGSSGSIVNMSSMGGRQPYGMSGAYSTVKAAVIMLADHFGIEWGVHQVRVNSICAGHTETPLTAYLQDPKIKKGRSDVTPLQRVAQPIDITNGILFLFSDEANYITATALDIDGGITKSVMNHMPGRKWR
jgi:NAD(P)-dependent dehydrogenase (short-subunit alcohol dehydrogenase family)|tara:strand:+ start:333 stop:1124 length:792 start_codon:yes stop_codon:yes gene_type:complete